MQFDGNDKNTYLDTQFVFGFKKIKQRISHINSYVEDVLRRHHPEIDLSEANLSQFLNRKDH